MPSERLRLIATALLVAFVALLWCGADQATACPTCKDGLDEDKPASQAMARGYFYSILFMMAMPFVIIGTFGSAAYLSIRRSRQRLNEQKETGSTDAHLADPG